MRRYTVKHQPTKVQTFQDEVIISTPTTLVEADYFRIEGGAAVFRCYPPQHEPYPQTVHVFAPGVWAEIELEL